MGLQQRQLLGRDRGRTRLSWCREINGVEAIRRWAQKEMVGDHVTMDVREVIDHHGDTIVRSRYDGSYDKTNLPAELVMSDYFSVRDGKIV